MIENLIITILLVAYVYVGLLTVSLHRKAREKAASFEWEMISFAYWPIFWLLVLIVAFSYMVKKLNDSKA